MLFRQEFLQGILDGAITLAFRRWRRPSVRAGGTLLTGIGQMSIGTVSRVQETEISLADARRAGYPSRDGLLEELNRFPAGDVYRIELKEVRPDPRVALRGRVPATDEADAILERLGRLDARAAGGAWTSRVLDVIGRHPAVRAGELCLLVGVAKDDLKINVRKLKTLGLTESLEVGYRLSPRGEAVLARLKRRSGRAAPAVTAKRARRAQADS